MQQKRRNRVGPLAFAMAVALFAAPSSPVVDAVPTVGGKALAYGPCTSEYMVMQSVQVVHDVVASLPTAGWSSWLSDYARDVYHEAVHDFVTCAHG